MHRWNLLPMGTGVSCVIFCGYGYAVSILVTWWVSDMWAIRIQPLYIIPIPNSPQSFNPNPSGPSPCHAIPPHPPVLSCRPSCPHPPPLARSTLSTTRSAPILLPPTHSVVPPSSSHPMCIAANRFATPPFSASSAHHATFRCCATILLATLAPPFV